MTTSVAAEVAATFDGHIAADVRAYAVVEVAVDSWVDSTAMAHGAGFAWFDSVTGLDDGDGSLELLLLLMRPGTPAERLGIRTRVPLGDPMPSLGAVFAGAVWHEREIAEMFGVDVVGGEVPARLLLDAAFVGAPLRKDTPLAARAVRAWPGAKEPGESDADVAAVGASPTDGSVAANAAMPERVRRKRRRASAPGVVEREADGSW